ncbi:diaminopimelate epimerase [Paenibacillus sp. J22TS3]|uniref:diaminopimelate epimerase n=1 Tax=Paenibacillus sp. J22TS3 TaxID=2807192 RepID=UPI001B059BC4|nr:diaminopimelate epimerase [Paenibacillus sp. J22TS3]GIP19739.1 histidine racemase CntK [Paenibacillus sp. J22TS3]
MRREIDFVKCSPTQNMTILVATRHPTREHALIASKIMSYDSVYAEQVGFIEESNLGAARAALRMAGGEFCGNACMALAAHIAAEENIKPHASTRVLLEVSGTDQLVSCEVKNKRDVYVCQVEMPLPKQIERKTIPFAEVSLDLAIVRYEDFIHIVMEVEQFDEPSRINAQTIARVIGAAAGSKLIGILLYQPQVQELQALIYVPNLDSLIWERGCGSGTASLGAYLAWKNQKSIEASIRQPGGTIEVAAYWNNRGLETVTISGNVSIVARGKAFVDI